MYRLCIHNKQKGYRHIDSHTDIELDKVLHRHLPCITTACKICCCGGVSSAPAPAWSTWSCLWSSQPFWCWLGEYISGVLCHPPAPTSQSLWAVQWSWFARVNALCNLSCKKSGEVTASLLGRFLSRHCFTLCITVEVEPRIAKQYKWQHCCSCKNYQGKGMQGGKKRGFASFLGWPEDREFVEKNAFWGIL